MNASILVMYLSLRKVDANLEEKASSVIVDERSSDGKEEENQGRVNSGTIDT